MTDLLTDALKRYGSVVFLAIVAAALLVWVAAHLTASPGAPVKVLWGFVEYTKRAESQRDTVAQLSPGETIPRFSS